MHTLKSNFVCVRHTRFNWLEPAVISNRKDNVILEETERTSHTQRQNILINAFRDRIIFVRLEQYTLCMYGGFIPPSDVALLLVRGPIKKWLRNRSSLSHSHPQTP